LNFNLIWNLIFSIQKWPLFPHSLKWFTGVSLMIRSQSFPKEEALSLYRILITTKIKSLERWWFIYPEPIIAHIHCCYCLCINLAVEKFILFLKFHLVVFSISIFRWAWGSFTALMQFSRAHIICLLVRTIKKSERFTCNLDHFIKVEEL
jgi:hypothetical protein